MSITLWIITLLGAGNIVQVVWQWVAKKFRVKNEGKDLSTAKNKAIEFERDFKKSQIKVNELESSLKSERAGAIELTNQNIELAKKMNAAEVNSKLYAAALEEIRKIEVQTSEKKTKVMSAGSVTAVADILNSIGK